MMEVTELYLCVCVCMSVCLCVDLCIYEVCLNICMHAHLYVCMYTTYVCIQLCVDGKLILKVINWVKTTITVDFKFGWSHVCLLISQSLDGGGYQQLANRPEWFLCRSTFKYLHFKMWTNLIDYKFFRDISTDSCVDTAKNSAQIMLQTRTFPQFWPQLPRERSLISALAIRHCSLFDCGNICHCPIVPWVRHSPRTNKAVQRSLTDIFFPIVPELN